MRSEARINIDSITGTSITLGNSGTVELVVVGVMVLVVLVVLVVFVKLVVEVAAAQAAIGPDRIAIHRSGAKNYALACVGNGAEIVDIAAVRNCP